MFFNVLNMFNVFNENTTTEARFPLNPPLREESREARL